MHHELTGLIVYFQVKNGQELQLLQLGQNLLPAILEEPSLVNFFQMQDTADPNRYALFETWACSKAEFLHVLMKRPYRQPYEDNLSTFLVNRDMQMDWRLIRSRINDATAAMENPEHQFAFFVYLHAQPGKEDRLQAAVEQVVEAMSTEEAFLSYFLLRNETDPTRFAVFETWRGTEEEFRREQMSRPYRRTYEEQLPDLLAEPREIQVNWTLRMSHVRKDGGYLSPLAAPSHA